MKKIIATLFVLFTVCISIQAQELGRNQQEIKSQIIESIKKTEGGLIEKLTETENGILTAKDFWTDWITYAISIEPAGYCSVYVRIYIVSDYSRFNREYSANLFKITYSNFSTNFKAIKMNFYKDSFEIGSEMYVSNGEFFQWAFTDYIKNLKTMYTDVLPEKLAGTYNVLQKHTTH